MSAGSLTTTGAHDLVVALFADATASGVITAGPGFSAAADDSSFYSLFEDDLSSGAGPEGPIVTFVQVLLLFEASLYSAVTPVLPHYAHVLGASKPAVGVLTAAYPAGLIPGSFLGGWLAVHVGVKRTTLFGLLLFAVSAIPFGFGSDIATLDLLRFVQGVASGCIWGGGLTWVIAVAPRQRRGEVLGSTIGAAILGTLLGPVLGTLAVAIGTGVVFSLIGAVSIGLAFWTGRHPEPLDVDRRPFEEDRPAAPCPFALLVPLPDAPRAVRVDRRARVDGDRP